MSKNIMPILIVIVVIAVGIGGILLLSNQKPPQSNPLDINGQNLPTLIPTATSVPPSAIISTNPTQVEATAGANMDNYITDPSGLKYLDETIGSGPQVKAGDTVTVNYIGTLENGTKFDSSFDRNQPFTTQIGVGQVIKGWDEGIIGMRAGGKRKLIIPPDLGYGNQPAGSIPPNSTLIFEVDLLSIK
jgi:FKBP-type peptidyl-prolyl cis-trans isomerase